MEQTNLQVAATGAPSDAGASSTAFPQEHFKIWPKQVERDNSPWATTCHYCGRPRSSIDNTLTQLRIPPSADLLSKVLAQNVRLKRALREILASKGLTASEYLVSNH